MHATILVFLSRLTGYFYSISLTTIHRSAARRPGALPRRLVARGHGRKHVYRRFLSVSSFFTNFSQIAIHDLGSSAGGLAAPAGGSGASRQACLRLWDCPNSVN